MNIAIVHPYRVRADSVGGVTRVYELARFLARRHRVVIGSHADDVGPRDSHQPGAEAGDADLAAMGVVQYACRRPLATGWAKARWWADPSAPYYVHRNENPALRTLLASLDATQPFDVVHLELGYMAPIVAGIGHAVRALAEQEAMPPRLDRVAARPWSARTTYESLSVATRRRAAAFDAATLPTFDLLYGTTPRERDYLSATAGRPAAVLPHVVSLDRFGAVMSSPHESTTVLFVGNFAHGPNVDAVQWFVRHVWPQVIARAGRACFEIVGAGLTDAMRRAFSARGVVVTGYQPDLASCYGRAAVVVSPVRSGGGMRGKVLEALATSSALVSTALGLEGVAATSGMHCTAAETPSAFAEAVLAYLANPAMRRAHGRAARALVADHYDAPVVFARLERDYENALAYRRPQRRTRA